MWSARSAFRVRWQGVVAVLVLRSVSHHPWAYLIYRFELGPDKLLFWIRMNIKHHDFAFGVDVERRHERKREVARDAVQERVFGVVKLKNQFVEFRRG